MIGSHVFSDTPVAQYFIYSALIPRTNIFILSLIMDCPSKVIKVVGFENHSAINIKVVPSLYMNTVLVVCCHCIHNTETLLIYYKQNKLLCLE
uniref:Uncharacterized protein n=1 Tax=Nelumbo nucifera TaxID=4432 RepID=A0A822ZJ93_NELNU|nr:TPA_asm: hypothetical protein HUJ06_004394 [Nelumbo nucifera]